MNLLGELKVSDDRKILNKGLDALLGEQSQSQKTVKNIEIKKIKAGRFQPRSNFDKDKLNELTNSIKKQLTEIYIIHGIERLNLFGLAQNYDFRSGH